MVWEDLGTRLAFTSDVIQDGWPRGGLAVVSSPDYEEAVVIYSLAME